jgi:agmatinase
MREKDDLSNDHRCGFSIITARDIDLIGAQGVIDALKKRVGNNKVYISLDIDSLDPAFAPGKPNSNPASLPRNLVLT